MRKYVYQRLALGGHKIYSGAHTYISLSESFHIDGPSHSLYSNSNAFRSTYIIPKRAADAVRDQAPLSKVWGAHNPILVAICVAITQIKTSLW